MVDFKKYEGTLTNLGTVASQIGAKGTIDFKSKNFNSTKLNAKGTRTRVAAFLVNGDGLSVVIPCSDALSDYLRKAKADGASKEELLAAVTDLNVMEGEEEQPFITMPAGEQSTGMTIAELKKVKKVAKIEALEAEVW